MEKPDAITVKDILVTPETVANNGAGAVEVRCTVFSRNNNARIEKVWADMRHTMLEAVFDHAPDPDNLLQPSAEGYYHGRFSIPRLMEPGSYRLPILARDSLGGEGMGVARFEVMWRLDGVPEIHTPEFARLQEFLGGSPFVPGNRVEVLEDGQAALAKRLELIEGATTQINLQTYLFEATGIGGRLMDALLKKAEQGVEVNLIMNSDSQLPASPLGALRLKVNQLFYDWTRAEEQEAENPEAQESFWEWFLPKKRAGGLNMILFRGRVLNGNPRGVSKPPMGDHWLSRILDCRNEKQGKESEDLLAVHSGPGGLPAIPLLDYAIHEKIMVVDGARAVVGGRNLEGRYFEQWKDLDLLLEGPVVKQVQAGFLKSFHEIAEPDNPRRPTPLYAPDSGLDGVQAQFVQSRPWAGQHNALLSMVNAMASCRSRFYAISQYLVLPVSLLRDAILDAASRGVDVRILTNSALTCKDVGFATAYYVTLNYLDALLKAGVRVYEAKGIPDEKAPQPYLHNKEFLFDGQLAAVGSFNLSMRSSHVESENLVFVCDEAFAQKREAAFLDTIAREAREITPEYLAELTKTHKTRIDMSRHLELLF